MSKTDILIEVLKVIGSVWMWLKVYEYVYLAVGLFKTKKFSPTEDKRKYGICIVARNEDKVIENILESIKRQKYPLDKLTVFIMAHNCTDQTALKAKNFDGGDLHIKVYEYNNSAERTKGFALKKLFELIKDDYGSLEAFDGYFIFDSDNLLSENYVEKMNEAFVDGNDAVTSFRSTKNVNGNWISFGYAMHWMRTCLKENRGKSVLKGSCRLQGTGYLFSPKLIKNGWKYTSLTEDRAFASDIVVQGYRVAYCDDAVFYDEQPEQLKYAWRQRVRWAKGLLCSSIENCPKLLRNLFKRNRNFLNTYDCFFINFPATLESAGRKCIKDICELTMAICAASLVGWWIELLSAIGIKILSQFCKKVAIEILVFIKYKDRIVKPKGFWSRLNHICAFPILDLIGRYATYVALFKKVEWKPIPHDKVIDLDKLK